MVENIFMKPPFCHQVERQLKDGATIIDIGGMSTRPNAELISEEEELKRVIEPIKSIHQHFPEAYRHRYIQK